MNFVTNKVKKSLGNYIISHYTDLNKCHTKEDVKNFVLAGKTEVNEEYIDSFVIPTINKQPNVMRAIDFVGRNLVLAGENMRAY